MSGEFIQNDEWYVTGDGTTYRFMFAHPTNLSNVSASPFAPKSTTGDRSYADYDAASALAMTDFSGGMGQDRFTDTTKYYDALHVDSRSGKLLLGPNAEPASFPPLTSFPALDTLQYVAVQAGATQRAVKLLIPSGATAVNTIQRLWLPLQAARGVGAITVKLFDDNANAPGTELAATSITLDKFYAFGQWVEAIFPTAETVTPNAAYWLQVTHTGAVPLYWACDYDVNAGGAGSLSWNGAQWVADTTMTPAVWYDDFTVRQDSPPMLFTGAGEDNVPRVWAWAGRTLFYYGANGAPYPALNASNTQVMDADITAHAWFRAPADTNTWLYLALGDATPIERFDANIGAEEWETLTGHNATNLCVHENLLVYGYDRNKIDCYNGTQWGLSPTAEPAECGDRTYRIRQLVSWNGNVWIGKDDGLYKLTIPAGYPVTGSLVCQKIIDFAPVADQWNFSFLVTHQGDLYFSIGNGIMRYTTAGLLQAISPDAGLNITADYRFYYKAAVSVLNTLWVLAESGLTGTGKLFAYTDGAWHPVFDFNYPYYQLLRSICVEPGWYGNMPRLWYGAGLVTVYVQMPLTTTRRWLWTGADYPTEIGGYWYSSWIDGNIRLTYKDWMTLEIDALGLAYDQFGERIDYITVAYRYSDNDGWTTLGEVNTNGLTKLTFGANSYSLKLQLRLHFYTTDRLYSPRVEAIALKYMERPDDIRSMARHYKLADRLENRNGVVVTRSLAQQLADLRTLRQVKEPVTLHTWYGTPYTVHVVDYSVSELPEEMRGTGDKGQMLAIVRLQEIIS